MTIQDLSFWKPATPAVTCHILIRKVKIYDPGV